MALASYWNLGVDGDYSQPKPAVRRPTAVIKSLVAALGLAAVLAQQAPPRSPDNPDVPGDLIRIGEHRLHDASGGVRAADSGQEIHRDNPAVAAQAIRDVREAALSGSRLALAPR